MTIPLQERQGYAKSSVMPTEVTPTDARQPEPPATGADENARAGKPPVSPVAARALAEAAARRLRQSGQPAADVPENAAKELNGRGGMDPTRYGDWEIKGLTSDF